MSWRPTCTPLSSVLCTHVALAIASELETTGSLIDGAVRYLASTYDHDYQYWPFLPDDATLAPHAPWWDDRTPESDRFSINPMLQALAWVTRYQDRIPDFPLADVTHHALTCLFEREQDFSKDAVECCLQYLEVAPPQDRHRIKALLLEIVPARIERDHSKWGGYCMRPLDVVASPSSILYAPAERLIEQNVTYLIETQHVNGSWLPNWTWRGHFPDDWEDAKVEWAGVMTLKTLQQLKSVEALPAMAW